MRNIFVADVGDGICISIDTVPGKTLQIDWGSHQGGEIAFKKGNYIDPEIFILSHFHVDHYNGLIYASNSAKKWNIEQVYYPKLPQFDEKELFIEYLFTMNLIILGNDSGIMEYDLLKAISRINRPDFF